MAFVQWLAASICRSIAVERRSLRDLSGRLYATELSRTWWYHLHASGARYRHALGVSHRPWFPHSHDRNFRMLPPGSCHMSRQADLLSVTLNRYR